MSRELKALVLDDDPDRVRQVMEVMPDYVDAMASRFVKDAQKLIVRDDGTKIDLLIMYADDPRAISLYLFDWMKKDSARQGLRRIPVVIYTDDEFSDRVMEFLEIDDLFIHEGEIDDTGFFSLLMEAIESIESYEDDFYDASLPNGGHSEAAEPDKAEETTDDTEEIITKLIKNNPERLMGAVLSAPSGENNEQRSMVITEADKIKTIIESIKASKEKTYQLRIILQDTPEDKEMREQLAKNFYSQELEAGGYENNNITDNTSRSNVASYSDAGPYSSMNIEHNTAGEVPILKPGYETPIIQGGRYDTKMPAPDTTPAKKTTQKRVTLANVYSRQNENMAVQAPAGTPVQNIRKKMLVVDTDVRTKLSLHYYYADAVDVDFANSSMTAIDYFIQNKPDIVLIEYDMPYVNGIMILDSIRRQPNGANVKAVILLDVSKHGDLITSIATRPGVTGIIYKPFVKEQFISTMQRCML